MQCLIVTDTKDTGRQLIPRQHSVVRVKSSIDSIIYAYCSPRFFDLATPRGSDSQVLCVYSLYYSAMGRGAEYCNERVCLCVCLSSCPRAYLRKYTFYLQFFYACCALPMALSRSCRGGFAMRYVLPVLSMTSCSHIIASKERREKAYTLCLKKTRH